MESTTPPWRAFDAPESPAPESRAPGKTAQSAAESGPAGATTAVRLPGPTVLIGIFLALGGLVLALAIAVTGAGGDVGLDGVTVRPFDSASAIGSDAAVGNSLVVDVGGAVAHPGVYRLARGARVADAIAAAGGYSPRVAASVVQSTLNLAAPVQDGQLIVVPSRDDPPSGQTGGPSSSGSGAGPGLPIDLNTATAGQLDSLPGIGPVTADKILAARQSAPFQAVADLLDRKLVGQKTFDGLKDLVTVH